MTRFDSYPAGVPCWVDTLVDDVPSAKRFYEGIFGWEFVGPGPMHDGGEYWVAQVGGRDVAGVGTRPSPNAPPAWTTYVAVDDVEAATRDAQRAGGQVLFEPTDALPAGRVAVVADPTGGVIGLWEPVQRSGAQTVNEHSAWAMSRLDTADPTAAATFYETVFGWRAEPFGEAPGISLLRLPGYVGGTDSQPVPRDVVAAMMDTTVHEAPTGWSVDFWIADVEAAAARAPQLGGRVLAEPFDIPMFRTAVLAAPGDAVFQVSQLTLPDR